MLDRSSGKHAFDQAMKLLVWFEVLSWVVIVVVTVMVICGRFDYEPVLRVAAAIFPPA